MNLSKSVCVGGAHAFKITLTGNEGQLFRLNGGTVHTNLKEVGVHVRPN